jgi:hypothetical protein
MRGYYKAPDQLAQAIIVELGLQLATKLKMFLMGARSKLWSNTPKKTASHKLSMETNLKKLVSISSEALCDDVPQIPDRLLNQFGELGEQLVDLLDNKNGFYAFESALHVLPAGCIDSCLNIEAWNDDSSWRKEYGDLVQGYLFFAEDVFGVQFALCNRGIRKFDPETGEFEDFASNLEEWAAKILEDYNYETGHQLAHDWQLQNGSLPAGRRLLPKIPFVLGGAYEVENLYAADALQGMMFRADIWRQIRELPDGSQIKLKVIK